MAKKMTKKTAPKPKRFWGWMKAHKLLSFLIFVIFFIASAVAWAKYDDYQNRQSLELFDMNLTLLKQDLEFATTPNIKLKKECFFHQQPFSTGPLSCRIIISGEGVNVESVKTVIDSKKYMIERDQTSSDRIREYEYNGENVCSLFYESDSFSLLCSVKVTKDNEQFAKGLFNK